MSHKGITPSPSRVWHEYLPVVIGTAGIAASVTGHTLAGATLGAVFTVGNVWWSRRDRLLRFACGCAASIYLASLHFQLELVMFPALGVALALVIAIAVRGRADDSDVAASGVRNE